MAYPVGAGGGGATTVAGSAGPPAGATPPLVLVANPAGKSKDKVPAPVIPTNLTVISFGAPNARAKTAPSAVPVFMTVISDCPRVIESAPLNVTTQFTCVLPLPTTEEGEGGSMSIVIGLA